MNATKWKICVEDRGGHDGAGTGGHYGNWARVWASKEDVVDVQVVQEWDTYRAGQISQHKNFIEVEVSLADGFDENKDFVLVEHKRSANPYLSGSSSRERFELLAGVMPAWASFPQAWREWVDNPEVQSYAAEHIRRKHPEAKDLVDFAERKGAKNRIIAAWCDVAEECGIPREDVWGNGSWTAARAMPIRIAQKLGGFRPPVPRPVWGRLDEGVNAFIVASPDA